MVCLLWIGAHDGAVHIWNVNNGKLLRRLDPRVDVLRDKNLKVSKGSDDVVGVVWSEEDQKIGKVYNLLYLFRYNFSRIPKS